MLVEPRPPDRAHRVARLQHRAQARTTAAAHETEVTAVFARHHFKNGIRLAVAPRAEHDSFVGPFHGAVLIPKWQRLNASSAQAARDFSCPARCRPSRSSAAGLRPPPV